MTFEEALEGLKENKGIRRSCWLSQDYVYWHPRFNRLRSSQGDRAWAPYESDRRANDWEILL